MRGNDGLDRPRLLQGDPVEEAQDRDHDDQGRGRQLFLLRQIGVGRPGSPQVPTPPEIGRSTGRSGRYAAGTPAASPRRDGELACPRACVGEGRSWGLLSKGPGGCQASLRSVWGGRKIRVVRNSRDARLSIGWSIYLSTAKRFSPTAVCDTQARAPSDEPSRVSYPMSDSMSCRRQHLGTVSPLRMRRLA